MDDIVIRDKRRQRIVIFSIAFASFMVNVDTYIVNISLPTIAKDFHTTVGSVSWVTLAYQLTITALLLTFGRLGDTMGLKKVFLLGFGVFTASSVMCGMSHSLNMLVLARALQGIGASMLFALTPAMIPRFLPGEIRGPAFGTLAMLTALGMTTGTCVGGLITGYLSWPWIFLVNLPIGIIAMLVVSRAIPDDSSVARGREKTPFDLSGAFLSFIAAFSFIYCLSRMNEDPLMSWPVLGCGVLSLAAWTFFVLQERSFSYPLINLNFFRDRGFLFGNLSTFMAYTFLAGTNFLMPFYLVIKLGLQPQQAGFAYLLYTAVYMIAGPVAGKLSAKVHPRLLCVFAMGVGSLTAVLFAFNLGSSSFIPAGLALSGVAITFGFFSTSNNAVLMSMAPAGKEGMVSGTFRMIMRLGLAVGVVIFETLFSMALIGHGGGDSSAYASVSHFILEKGFRNAYLAGGVTCFLALTFSYLAKPRPEAGLEA